MVYDEKNEEGYYLCGFGIIPCNGEKMQGYKETTKGNILKRKDATFKLLQGGTSL